MRKLNSLKLLLSALLLAIGCNVWGEKVSIASWTYASRAANTAYNPSTSDANNSSAILKSECALTTAGSGGSSSAYYGSWTNGKAILISGLSMTGYVNNSIVLTINLRHRNSGTASFYYSTDGTSYPSTANATKSITNTSTDYAITSIPNNVKTIKVVISSNTAGNLWLGNVTIEGEKAASNPYTVTFNVGSNGSFASGETFDAGTTDQRTEASAGAGVTLPNVTANTGYEFIGWSTEEAPTCANAGVAGDTYYPSENTPLYAYYKQLFTINYATTENGKIVVKNGGVPLANGAEVTAGITLTIECTPVNEDYQFKNWQYKVGEGTWATKYSATQEFEMPEGNTQFRANFEEIPTFTVAFSVNGAIVKSEDLKEGAAVSIPDVVVPAGITKVFTGWIETATVEGETPAYVTPIETATKAATYYAVFANVSGTPASIEKLNGTHSFAAGENIVVVATGTDWAKNMYQETVSSSYVKYENFTNSVDFVSEDNKRYFTLSAGSTTGTWKLGDATNGYVYNESNNDLTVTTANSSNWTIAWNNDKSKFSIKNGNRWLSCRSDLPAANQYKFRGGGTSPASGTVYFDLYLYTASNEELSDFTTTPGYSLTTADNDFYSLYLPYEVAIPDGIEAYTGELGNNTLTLTAVEDYIPAETAVLVKSTTYPVTYSFTPSNTGASISATNSLKGVLVDTDYSELYESGETLFTLNTGSNGVGFYKPKDGATTLKANRAYLLVTTQNPAPVRIVMPNDVATAIENNSEAVKANKTLIDGRLYILRDGNMFDLNGRLVK